VITAGLAVLLLSLLSQGTVLQVGLVSFALVFIHANMFWVVPTVGLLACTVNWLTSGRGDWGKLGAGCLGGLIGLCLRPNPLGSLQFLKVQIFAEMFTRMTRNIGLTARELQPMSRNVFDSLLPLIIIWGIAILVFCFWFARKDAIPDIRQRRFVWASLILSILFFGLTYKVAMRSLDFFCIYSITFSAGVLACCLRGRSVWHFKVSAVSLLVLFFLGLNAVTLVSQSLRDHPSDMLHTAGEWLAKNAQPGDIIFNLNIDNFGGLYYWNPQGRYVWGMDTFFLYDNNKRLYWEAGHLFDHFDSVYTYSTESPNESAKLDPVVAMHRDFHAKWAVIGYPWETLAKYMAKHPKCKLRCFDDQYMVAVIELLD
jgi:hypothetical protein